MFNQLFESLMELEVPGKYWGVDEAGWIHPNGQVEEIPNYHAGDHDKDAFEKLNPDQEWADSENYPKAAAYKEYLKQGHIRYVQSNRGFNIELIARPTTSQMKAIRKEIEEGTGEFYFSMRTRTSYGPDGSSWKEFREEVARLP